MNQKQLLFYYNELNKPETYSSRISGAVLTFLPAEGLIEHSKAMQVAKRMYGWSVDADMVPEGVKFKLIPLSAAWNTWNAYHKASQFFGTSHAPQQPKVNEDKFPVLTLDEINDAIAAGEIDPSKYLVVCVEKGFHLTFVESVGRAK